ncbi:MAG: DUF3127 domain-containing protein [Bacteroidales bacterium]|nr:DUF3127 domain-containing protein [Bacteroidales bacterium]
MEIIGKIIQALPEVSGTSQAGRAWKKREYVLQTMDNSRPRNVFFDFFGDAADQYPLTVGQEIKLSFDIESREWQGRWFTSIRGWKAEPAYQQQPAYQQPAYQQPQAGYQPAQPAYQQPAQAPAQGFAPQQAPGAVPPPPMPAAGATDDLPF